MKLRGLMLASSFALWAFSGAGSAFADTYFSLHGAITRAKEFSFQVAPGTIETDFDDGYGIGFAIGTELGQPGGSTRVRVEEESTHRANDVDTHTLNGSPLAGSRGDLGSTAVMANLALDLSPEGMASSYLGAGAGLAQVKASKFGASPVSLVLDDKSDSNFAYQLIAAIGWDVSTGHRAVYRVSMVCLGGRESHHVIGDRRG